MEPARSAPLRRKAPKRRKNAMPRPRRVRRRSRRLLKLFLFCILCVVFFQWSNHSLQTVWPTFSSPRLPEGFDGCVIVQLSDLHGAEFGEGNEDLIRRVREIHPDYIFLTGDLQDQYRQTPRSYSVSLGRAMAEIAPSYFVTGNHEWALRDVRALKRELQEAGVTVLTNEYTTLTRNGSVILLASTIRTDLQTRKRRRSWRRSSAPQSRTPFGSCWPTGTITSSGSTAALARIW